jgi:hypothetical protein
MYGRELPFHSNRLLCICEIELAKEMVNNQACEIRKYGKIPNVSWT